jgi:hypothetical protein
MFFFRQYSANFAIWESMRDSGGLGEDESINWLLALPGETLPLSTS